MKNNYLSSEKFCNTLNAMAEGLPIHKIASIAEVSTGTVHKLMHEMPLWEYFRKARKHKED